MKIKYEVIIEIDEENIAKKYPNFTVNYGDNKEGYKQFADGFIPNSMDDTMEQYGFDIKYKEGVIIDE